VGGVYGALVAQIDLAKRAEKRLQAEDYLLVLLAAEPPSARPPRDFCLIFLDNRAGA
jgi:hypothetical protein